MPDEIPCTTCKYGDKEAICTYILVAQHRRPCPAGIGCTVYEPVESRRERQQLSLAPNLNRKSLDETEAYRLYKSGANDREIAEAMHLQTSAVSYWRIQNKLPSQTAIYASNQLKQLCDLFETGASDKEIGEALGVGIYRVRAIRSKHGLRRPAHLRAGSSDRPQR